MPSKSLHLATVALLALVAAKPNIAKPDPAAPVSDARKSVALVERNGRIAATAFCIDASGVFVTNAAAVHGELRKNRKGGLLLILNAGTPRQQSIWAEIQLEDPDLDIALLRTSLDFNSHKLPPGAYVPLELSVSAVPDKDTAVTALGFRAGPVQPKKGPYPPVTTTSARVASLHRDGETVKHLQLDKPLNAASIGGPVLADDGHLVGIVVAGALGAAPNRALPIGQVRDLLAMPLVEFVPTPVPRDELGKPRTFEVTICSFEQLVGTKLTAKTQTVELVFPPAGDQAGDARTFPAAETTAPGDAQYKITADVPLPAGNASEVVCKVVLKRDGDVTAELEAAIPIIAPGDDDNRRKR